MTLFRRLTDEEVREQNENAKKILAVGILVILGGLFMTCAITIPLLALL